MSQGDYIRYKRISNELVEQSKLDPILSARKYTNYKEYTIENTVLNQVITYEKQNMANVAKVFGINKSNPQTCPMFILCNGTNLRANRRPLLGMQAAAQPLCIPPVHKTKNMDKLYYCKHCRKKK